MKKMVSKIAIATLTATMAISSMMSISASANDGMTKEEADAAAAIANAAAYVQITTSDCIADFINESDITPTEAPAEISAEIKETPTEAQETPTESKVNIFAQGNWYSLGMGGVVNYYFDPTAATGSRTSVENGSTDCFTYDFSGNRIVFYYGSYTESATVSYSGYDIVLAWDYGKTETLSTNYPGVDIEPVVTTITTSENERYNQPMLARGTWYASSASGARTYNFDILEPFGNMKDFDGTSKDFEYTLNGADLELHFIGAAKGEHATVTFNTGNTITLSWASGLVETLSCGNNTAPNNTSVTTAPATTPAATTPAKTEVKKTETTKAATQSAVSTTATQTAKKAPATASESPKTGDKLPVIAIGVAAIAAAAGILTFKKSPRK